jgi:hypothetical protein
MTANQRKRVTNNQLLEAFVEFRATVTARLDGIAGELAEVKEEVKEIGDLKEFTASCSARQEQRWTNHTREHNGLKETVGQVIKTAQDNRVSIAKILGAAGASSALTVAITKLAEALASK